MSVKFCLKQLAVKWNILFKQFKKYFKVLGFEK